MAGRIYFTENNLGILDGLEAAIAREKTFADLIKGIGSCCSTAFKLSGFAFSRVVGALSIDIAAGTGVINGRFVEQTTTVRVTGLTPSTTENYIFVKYVTDGNDLATSGPTFFSQATPTGAPANSLLLGRCETDATEVIVAGMLECKIGGSPLVFSYTGDGATSRHIAISGRPKMVAIYGNPSGYPAWGFAFGTSFQPPGIKSYWSTATSTYVLVFSSSNAVIPLIDDWGFTITAGVSSFNINGTTYYCAIWM